MENVIDVIKTESNTTVIASTCAKEEKSKII